MSKKSKIVRFPQGIPGFETHHEFRFVLEEEAQFAQLISVQEDRISFFLLRPEVYFPDYLQGINIDEESIKLLNVSGDVLVDVWVILTLNHQDLVKTTANLRAPILFNIAEEIGMQVILNDERYLSRQPLFKGENPQPLQEGVAG